jgi:cytochrome c oxidase subunit I+III
MTAQRTLDVSHLPEYDVSNQAPLWWGQALLGAIESTMFLILVAMYFYIRQSFDVWPPPGSRPPALFWGTIAWIPMLASTAGSYYASEAAKKNEPRGMLLGLSANLGLALVCLACRYRSWSLMTFTWYSDAHGSLVWTIIGLHSIDVIADLVFTAVLIFLIATRRIGGVQRLAVHVDSVVWYVLVAIWVPLYVVIYWGPRFLAAP